MNSDRLHELMNRPIEPPDWGICCKTACLDHHFPEYLLQIKYDNNAIGEPGGDSLQSNS
jgi:hypothetical protein